MNRRAVVAGALAQRPHRGGHAWVFLNWLFGLRSLGFDVTFVDRLPRRDPGAEDWLAGVMAYAGLDQQWALMLGRQSIAGLTTDAVEGRLADADVLFDVMGHLHDDTLIRATRRAVFVDIDPGFGQMWEDLGLASMFGQHRHHVTVGLNVGGRSQVPDRGIAWIPTLPPVSLEHWCCPSGPPDDAPVSSVATWRGPFDPVEYGGERFGLRAHQFRRFLSLAGSSPRFIELALDIDPADDADRRALLQSGFRLVDPVVAAGSPAAFRAYVHGSAGELCIAKDLYVRSRSGWFSDRSACYLAAGRPVAHQDTGLGQHLPGGGGLALFTDPPSAAGALRWIGSDPGAHGDAARRLAASNLDARLVIGRVLEQVGVS